MPLLLVETSPRHPLYERTVGLPCGDHPPAVGHDPGPVLAESLGEVGVLTGSMPAAGIAALSAVAGVSAIEENRTDYRTQQ